jgi:hypothetical protein
MEIDTDETLNGNYSHFDITELIPDLKQKLSVYSKSLESEKLNDENFTRVNILESYKNQSFEFTSEYSNNREYIQYSRTYFSRLIEIKKDLMRQASEKWRNFRICENILDVRGKVKNIRIKIYLNIFFFNNFFPLRKFKSSLE